MLDYIFKEYIKFKLKKNPASLHYLQETYQKYTHARTEREREREMLKINGWKIYTMKNYVKNKRMLENKSDKKKLRQKP